MNKKLITMMSAMAMCFSALPLQAVHAETADNIVNPDCDETYVDVQDVLPEWIPTSFTEALQFDNTYGRTHIQDGLICCVRQKYNRIDCCEYLTEYSGDDSMGLLTLFNKTYNFELPEKPDESDEEACQEYLEFLYSNGISEFEAENNLVYVDYEYEVTVYGMNPTSKAEINWIEKNQQTDRIVSTTTLSFESSKDGVITETDLYGWFPDTENEGYKFTKNNGEISIHNDCIVVCSDICWDGGYSMIVEQDGTAKLDLIHKETSSYRHIVPLDGGSSTEARIYKPVASGTVKVTFKEAREWEQDGKEVHKVVKYYSVDEDGNITEIDESDFTPLNMGDCNLDGKTGIADVIMLKKWLMGSGELKCWQNADFNNDNRVDVFDLVLMKQSLLENLPAVSTESDEVDDSDVTMIKQAVLAKYPDADMSDFTFVYEPAHQLNHHSDGKFFSVYYKDVLLHGYGNINTYENVYAVIKEKNDYKSVEVNFVVDPERFKEVNLDGEYKTVEEIKQSIDKYKLANAEKEPQFIIYARFTGNLNYEFKPAYLVKWNDYECIYDAVTGEEIEYIPYYVV